MDYKIMEECNICYEMTDSNPCINNRCTLKICQECFDIYTIDYNYTTCPQCNIDWPQKEKDTSETVIRWREDIDRYKVLFMLFFILFLIILIIYSIASQNHR